MRQLVVEEWVRALSVVGRTRHLVMRLPREASAALSARPRAGTILVGAAGVTVLAGSYVLLFGGSLGWGWELVMLVEGLALLAFAARRLEPGPGYLAFFALAIGTAAAALNGGRRARARSG
jgi:hypothetical protein